MSSISVSASVQVAPPSTGTSAAGIRPEKRTFSLTGVMGTGIVRGDVVALWGSNDGGGTYQPLRQNGQQVLLNFSSPEIVIDDCCDHYGTQRLAVGTGSTLAAVGFNGEAIYINPSPAWVQGGNSGFGPVGILGTTDAVPFRIIAQGVDIFDSDGSITALGNTEVGVPGNRLELAAGAGGGQFAVSGAGAFDLTAETGPLTIDTTTGAIAIGAGATAKNITIGSITGASITRVRCGTGGLGLGDDAVDHATSIGSTTGASLTSIQGGTSGVSISPAATGPLSMDSGTTGAINLGTGAAAKAITIGNGTSTTSVAINGGTGAMSFGANAVAHAVTIGSITGAASTSVRAGTGGLTLINNGVTWTWPTAVGAAGTKLTDAAGNGILSWT